MDKFGWYATECGKKVGIIGPSDATASEEEVLRDGKKFRMMDGDGNILFYGKFLMNKSCDGFEPLDQYGGPGYGCTSIEYLDGVVWTEL